MRTAIAGRAAAAGAGVLLALALTGCGESGPKLYPVRGKVTLKDGTPVKYGHVILHPDAGRGNASKEVCQGTIRDGEYVIHTGARSGAPAGAYKVAIEAAADVDPNNPYFTEWFADQKYVSQDTSGLALEVTDGGGPHNFQLDPYPHAKKQAAEKEKAKAASGVPAGK